MQNWWGKRLFYYASTRNSIRTPKKPHRFFSVALLYPFTAEQLPLYTTGLAVYATNRSAHMVEDLLPLFELGIALHSCGMHSSLKPPGRSASVLEAPAGAGKSLSTRYRMVRPSNQNAPISSHLHTCMRTRAYKCGVARTACYKSVFVSVPRR